MGRPDKTGLKKGPWTPEEDKILVNYIQKNGHGNWRDLPEHAGLLRCGKSCRLRWTNYLRPDIKRGSFTQQEEQTIIQLHGILGNRWSVIASQLPGRTDNEIKNFWNTHLKKRLLKMGLDPSTHAPIGETNPTRKGFEALALTRHKAQWENARLEAEARLSRESLLMSSNSAAGYDTNRTGEIITMPSDNPPTDYFLKIWNSEAGKVFRNGNHHPKGRGDDPVLWSEIPLISVSSLCCSSTQNSCDKSLHPNDKHKDNGFQQCNSASFDRIGDCYGKTPKLLSCFSDMTVGQTEDNYREELDFPEILLDFPDNDDNINNNSNIQSELSTAFQRQPSSPWPELHDEDYWSNLSFTAHPSAHS